MSSDTDGRLDDAVREYLAGQPSMPLHRWDLPHFREISGQAEPALRGALGELGALDMLDMSDIIQRLAKGPGGMATIVDRGGLLVGSLWIGSEDGTARVFYAHVPGIAEYPKKAALRLLATTGGTLEFRRGEVRVSDTELRKCSLMFMVMEAIQHADEEAALALPRSGVVRPTVWAALSELTEREEHLLKLVSVSASVGSIVDAVPELDLEVLAALRKLLDRNIIELV